MAEEQLVAAAASLCQLLHHGAAANNGNHVAVWIGGGGGGNDNNDETSSQLAWASHGIVTIAARQARRNNAAHVWKTVETLRSAQNERTGESTTQPIITCLATASGAYNKASSDNAEQQQHVASFLVAGWSNGSLSVWQRHNQTNWVECLLVSCYSDEQQRPQEERSITTLDAAHACCPPRQGSPTILYILTGSSESCILYQYHRIDNDDDDNNALVLQRRFGLLRETAIQSVRISPYNYNYNTMDMENGDRIQDERFWLLVGTAAPRHNKIHVFHHHAAAAEFSSYAGSLTGHEDWVTSLAVLQQQQPSSLSSLSSSWLLASGSQDCKIRLWKFCTSTTAANACGKNTSSPLSPADSQDDDDDSDDEGESRLEFVHPSSQTNEQATTTTVTLEALLIGHEASITSVQWHPHPWPLYACRELLLSSSMDRSILLWASSSVNGFGGIWTPLSRVGSAGGILGGPIASSLLGYCQVLVEPRQGRVVVGHAYGGALHVWQVVEQHEGLDNGTDADGGAGKENDKDRRFPNDSSMTMEDRACLVKWKASPGITGHFKGVTDLCWEAAHGDYLLTVSHDQTCRLWAPLWGEETNDDDDDVWVELSRPQVHGYNLHAVTSLSTRHHPHLLVTGADEKELRVFDAPINAIQLLKSVGALSTDKTGTVEDSTKRVERAYIPALGLTNKASAADQVEQVVEDEDIEGSTLLAAKTVVGPSLPLERDLGAVSIWPETTKLFGHNSELYCLASTTTGSDDKNSPLLASSAKARTVEDAALRLWNVSTGNIQTLQGHKSTVATLCFSPRGKYLASSGKDRRLCIWTRGQHVQPPDHPAYSSELFVLGWSKESAHKRIVWSVDFLKEGILASGSRDGCIKVWSIRDDHQERSSSLLEVSCIHSFSPSHSVGSNKPDSVTALAFYRSKGGQHDDENEAAAALLAVGLESGRIELWKVVVDCSSDSPPLLVLAVPPTQCHASTITKLAWQLSPSSQTQDDHPGARNRNGALLASCSMDHGCRIFRIMTSSMMHTAG